MLLNLNELLYFGALLSVKFLKQLNCRQTQNSGFSIFSNVLNIICYFLSQGPRCTLPMVSIVEVVLGFVDIIFLIYYLSIGVVLAIFC